MKVYKTVGIVLKRINFHDTDRILTIFAKDLGKIRIIAKGIRKTASRKAGHLEIFSYVKLVIAKGRTFDIVIDAQKVKDYGAIRKNLKKIAYGYQICELIDRFIPENQTNNSLFEIVARQFELLCAARKENEYDVNMFIHEIFWDLGFLPREKSLESQEIEYMLNDLAQKNIKSNELLTMVRKIS